MFPFAWKDSWQTSDIIMEAILLAAVFSTCVSFWRMFFACGQERHWRTGLIGINIYLLGIFVDLIDELVEFPDWFRDFVSDGLLAIGLLVFSVGIHYAVVYLLNLSNMDALTKLYNREYFFNMFRSALRHCEKKHSSLVIMFLDLNGFKQVNDTLGHDDGDRVLQQVGAVLQQSVPSSAVVARFGGDEFVILFPNVSKEEAQRVLNHMQKQVENLVDEEHVKLSISGGIAVYPEDGTTAEELLNTADERMYANKREMKKADYTREPS